MKTRDFGKTMSETDLEYSALEWEALEERPCWEGWWLGTFSLEQVGTKEKLYLTETKGEEERVITPTENGKTNSAAIKHLVNIQEKVA